MEGKGFGHGRSGRLRNSGRPSSGKVKGRRQRPCKKLKLAAGLGTATEILSQASALIQGELNFMATTERPLSASAKVSGQTAVDVQNVRKVYHRDSQEILVLDGITL